MYTTHTQCTKHTANTTYKTFIQTRCSAVVSPLALALPTPRVTHLPRMEHKPQQESSTARDPSCPRGAGGPFQLLPTSPQRPWQESGPALGHQPSPAGSQGEPWCFSGNVLPLPQKEKTPEKRNSSLFHLENPSATSVWWLGKVLLEERGRGDERMHWVVSFQTSQVTLLACPAFIYFTAAELVVFRFLSPQSFVKPSPRENESHPCATARPPRGSSQGALAAPAPTHQPPLGTVGFKKPSTKQHHRFLWFFLRHLLAHWHFLLDLLILGRRGEGLYGDRDAAVALCQV